MGGGAGCALGERRLSRLGRAGWFFSPAGVDPERVPAAPILLSHFLAPEGSISLGAFEAVSAIPT